MYDCYDLYYNTALLCTKVVSAECHMRSKIWLRSMAEVAEGVKALPLSQCPCDPGFENRLGQLWVFLQQIAQRVHMIVFGSTFQHWKLNLRRCIVRPISYLINNNVHHGCCIRNLVSKQKRFYTIHSVGIEIYLCLLTWWAQALSVDDVRVCKTVL